MSRTPNRLRSDGDASPATSIRPWLRLATVVVLAAAFVGASAAAASWDDVLTWRASERATIASPWTPVLQWRAEERALYRETHGFALGVSSEPPLSLSADFGDAVRAYRRSEWASYRTSGLADSGSR